MNAEVAMKMSGFFGSLLLTFLTYFIITNPASFNFNVEEAIWVIFVLALIQALVQLIFFINVWNEKGPLWNLGVFISTVSVIFIVIYFSIWIINNLNHNMH